MTDVTVEEAIALLCDPDAKLDELGYTWLEDEKRWTKFPELHRMLRGRGQEP